MQINKQQGMAPGAKLAAYDFGDAAGALDAPADAATEMFQPAYAVGARVFTNSWGVDAPSNYYDSRTAGIDAFVYQTGDALVLFAAGNRCAFLLRTALSYYGTSSSASPPETGELSFFCIIFLSKISCFSE